MLKRKLKPADRVDLIIEQLEYPFTAPVTAPVADAQVGALKARVQGLSEIA